mmetsp:Transcript_70298/g.161214  ORF Transcript_70298/g.161214 Transcript_70298/m.161214 type:complete len:204 (+) Transcript_70298:357-968(+)
MGLGAVLGCRGFHLFLFLRDWSRIFAHANHRDNRGGVVRWGCYHAADLSDSKNVRRSAAVVGVPNLPAHVADRATRRDNLRKLFQHLLLHADLRWRSCYASIPAAVVAPGDVLDVDAGVRGVSASDVYRARLSPDDQNGNVFRVCREAVRARVRRLRLYGVCRGAPAGPQVSEHSPSTPRSKIVERSPQGSVGRGAEQGRGDA